MSKRIVLSLIIILLSVIANAQTVIVSGKTIDIENKAPISGSTIQLFKTDSTYVNGAISDSIGSFILTDIKKGNYKLKISSISFCDTTLTINIHELNDINLGNISLTRDAIMLDETTVTALLPKMVVKEDTIVYNADAYQVPEGSAIEALVEQLPGTKVDDTGKITVNGKEIKKVRLDGREMMGGNSTSDMLKNLPSYIVDKIKSYDEKSDMAKLTGIDDGEETAVLDFTIKPRMRNGINAHIDAGYGTKDRYGVNSSVSRFSGKTRFTISGGANNVNNNGFSGRRGGRGGSNGGNGQRTSKNVSLQLNYDNKNNLKWNGGISWQHANTDSQTKTAAENFISRNGAFSNSRSQNNSRRDNINANFRIEWNPDTLTTISMRPSASYSTNDSHSSNLSASYNDDPYAYVSDPLNEDDIHHLAEDSLMVNYRSSKSVSYGNSKSLGTSFMVHRRLSATGRNINFNANINYSNSKNKNVSANNVHLYQIKNQWGNDSTYQTNRYTMRPSENFSYSLQVTYTEPLLKNIFLQTSYQFRYNHTKRHLKKWIRII